VIIFERREAEIKNLGYFMLVISFLSQLYLLRFVISIFVNIPTAVGLLLNCEALTNTFEKKLKKNE
jgi:hypothetical protein